MHLFRHKQILTHWNSPAGSVSKRKHKHREMINKTSLNGWSLYYLAITNHGRTKRKCFFITAMPSLCSHIRCEAHYNEISCFTKYNINSVVTVFIIGSHTSLSTTLIQWECSWFLILCFHSVLFCCNFQLRNKRECVVRMLIFLWNMTYHWSRKQMKNEIKTMRMRLICFFGRPKPPHDAL